MHPPFYIVDHRAAPDAPAPWEDRPHVRRGGPARLELGPRHPATGTGFAALPDASGSPPARAGAAGGVWPRLRALIARRPAPEPAR
ncbi:hypothetical protein [Limimaricola pyoseonensis]|uniref:Uncharacterized protein n=1 Tax=Limimaricola pyoseonensis TaxID=521013 RepID=A0A1G7CLU8_9RHOB|nr:hypothetical protein [Limimaricola pyoseonensis]SDE39435.1 hypothetical protein SAMN04488567_1525 [Limimaricola pyoseonensis]